MLLSTALLLLPLTFACSERNDLYRALASGGASYPRYDTPREAVARAPAGSGVLILAGGYPERATAVDGALFEAAGRKKLRLYVEYPSALPGFETGAPRSTRWERAVVASGAFGPSLQKLRILAIHDCRFIPVRHAAADLVVARVAGFDTAVYGLPQKDVYPILFEHPRGNLLVATTKLSQFITGRYAPAEAWGPVWRRVLAWLAPGRPVPEIRWTPAVRPSFTRGQPLPSNAELEAMRRGIDWYFKARMFVHPSWKDAEEQAGKYPDRVGPKPEPGWPSGDGSLGVLEGFNSSIRWDGSQLVRWWLRNDCIGETAMALALASAVDRNAAHARVAANLTDFIYYNSVLASGSRADPKSASFGLVGWNTVPRYHQDMDGFGVYYGDDNARSMLGAMTAAAVLQSDRWDRPLLRCLLANLRTTGPLGFRGSRLDEAPLQKNGWRHYFTTPRTNYAPHYEAYSWAAFLWAYHKTGYPLFLERTRKAIRMTMQAYPREWKWTNGIQQERARMLLPLAWLVRLENTREHRAWLERMARDLLAAQDASGAIREELGAAGRGAYGPPESNEAYGSNEATLIQRNGDPLADLLYTTNFAFLGLHEAAAATGDRFYQDAADRLARFLTRIQARSETRPELDGAWFRAFEFHRWEYWASNADAGWGAWSVETGWTQSWITAILAMRRMKTSVWDLTAGSRIRRHLKELEPLMLR
ncbi:MAG: hypothetical protein IT158_13020 [Bryobacterales bacterium]|nr:hypothetical protein [Bryobacterales bacterium]